MIKTLEGVFEAQARLNARCSRDPEALNIDSAAPFAPFERKLAGEWINDYIAAIHSELEELRDCTYWKHWCKEAQQGGRFELHNLQNARVELVDILFFTVSIALCLGVDADLLFKLYEQKLAINNKRQDVGYSVANKVEDDNKTVS